MVLQYITLYCLGKKEDDTVRYTAMFRRCRKVFTGAPIPRQTTLVDVKISPTTRSPPLNTCFYIKTRSYYYNPRRDMLTNYVGVNKRYKLNILVL